MTPRTQEEARMQRNIDDLEKIDGSAFALGMIMVVASIVVAVLIVIQ